MGLRILTVGRWWSYFSNGAVTSVLLNGESKGKEGDCSTSISGLQVAIVIDGNEVIRECRETGGTGYLISDEDVGEWRVD